MIWNVNGLGGGTGCVGGAGVTVWPGSVTLTNTVTVPTEGGITKSEARRRKRAPVDCGFETVVTPLVVVVIGMGKRILICPLSELYVLKPMKLLGLLLSWKFRVICEAEEILGALR